MLPIIRIDQLAKELDLETKWIHRNWLNPPSGKAPMPHFRDGRYVWFNREEIGEWSKRRSYGLDSTDTETDPTG